MLVCWRSMSYSWKTFTKDKPSTIFLRDFGNRTIFFTFSSSMYKMRRIIQILKNEEPIASLMNVLHISSLWNNLGCNYWKTENIVRIIWKFRLLSHGNLFSKIKLWFYHVSWVVSLALNNFILYFNIFFWINIFKIKQIYHNLIFNFRTKSEAERFEFINVWSQKLYY